MIYVLKTGLRKETEEGLLFDGLKKLVLQIAEQNTYNMNMIVTTLKESFPVLDPSMSLPPSSSKMKMLTKPAKVPSRSRNLTLETLMKQLQTWTEINDKVPEFVKFHDFIKSLKVNKDIKDLPQYVGEHILPVLEKKQDQTIKKVLELLDIKYGRSRMEKVEECVEDLLKF